ncbi:hypothetical protein GCM10023185_14570 [Hymenobacter saemangeumensis]|uniref:Gingipain domain-containing protein n=1 Tax=Hymenobacter saemangeumensis TaxID=1084522 RepID=A0ABP8I8L5_9BACT
MNKSYQWMRLSWSLLLVVAGLFALAQPAAAQSGPYGNEWIEPGQQYYKLKVWRDGIYKIDYQYLVAAGITGVDPTRIQLWRRGREVAIYQGGSTTVLDPTTYFEFFGQRNDGKLDAEFYKNPAEQAHQYYSFYTDTAAYFLTYSVGPTGRAGRRMATPVAAGGTPHGWRLQTSLKLENYAYMEAPSPSGITFLPWLQAGEGFISVDWGNGTSSSPVSIGDVIDSLLRAVPPAGVGPAPVLEVGVVGSSATNHTTDIRVVAPGNMVRTVGTITYNNYAVVRPRYPIQRSDIAANGRFEFQIGVNNPNLNRIPKDLFRVSYFSITAPQYNRWFSNRSHVYFRNDSLLGGPATFEVDTIPATVRGFDIHDPWNVQRIEPTAAQTLGQFGRRFVFPSATGQQSRRLLLYDLARTMRPAPARRVQFRNINPAVPNYLIVTHKQLMGPATRSGGGTVPNAAKAYAEYRASAAGGRYDTLMMTSHQLYDQFHYGERSVMAIRHFGLWMAANAPTGQTKYLMLLGKGIGPNEFFGSGNSPLATRTLRIQGERGLDLVPTSTRGISDNFLTSDFRNNDFHSKLPTGRIVAKTPQEVIDYLDKVIVHESPNPLNPAPAAWRKNVLHMSGGANPFEFGEFDGFLNQYKRRAESPCWVGRVVRTYSRTTVGGYTSLPVSINIANELNPGLSLITYFGHGSNTDFALNIGNVTDPSNNYNNQGKYPVMFYNGCAAGQLYVNYPTFGENWLFAANKGSVGMMGETGLSYAYLLHPAQDSMYQRLFNNPSWYGKPIAQVHGEVVKSLQLQVDYQTPEGIEQLLCTTWHGDPVLRMYSPQLPDFQTSNPQLSIAPGPASPVLSAASPNLTLNVGVINPGNFCLRNGDSLRIRVTRTYGTPSRVESTLHRVRQIHQTNATYSLVLPNTGAGIFGNNRFVVELDYGNHEPELDENNNTAEIYYNFLQGGVTLLNPVEFAMVPTNTPRLVAQTNTPNGSERAFEFELDTVPTFTSPGRPMSLRRGAVTAEWTPTLPAAQNGDSLVWYWRVRLQTPLPDEDANWVNSSFRVVPGLLGWSQSHYGQFRRDLRQGIEVDAPSGRWHFTDELKPLQLRTRGGGLPGSAATFTQGTGYGIIADPMAPPFVNNCAVRAPNIMVAVYDRVTLRPKTVAGASLRCGQGTQEFYIFAANPTSAADTLNNINNSAARQGELSTLLNNVPNGDYVALIGMNRVRWASLPASLKSQLATLLGSQLINQLQNGDPLALLAQKNSAGGRLVREVGPSTAGTTPRYDQIISLADTLRTPSTRGRIVSTRIGPAQQWESLSHWVEKDPNTSTSSYTLSLIGINAQGQSTVLNNNVPTAGSLTSYSLASVSAQQYPYLQLELVLQDTVSRLAPQLQEWFVAYQGLPEGVVRRDLISAASYDPARIAAQAAGVGTISFPVKFANVSAINFGTPLKAIVAIHENSGGLPGREVARREITAPRQLMANDTITFQASLNVIGRFGSFIPVVTVNPPGPNALPELNYFNNQLVLASFSVADANLPPVLDVAFDGRRILNGELVSPRPSILIQVNDEDRLRHIRNVSYFTVTLQRQGQNPVPVDLRASNISFSVDSTRGSVARLEYRPGQGQPLADGMYTLRVQVRDPSGTTAGNQEMEVKFEVVNASTITNVFPYPNPVTSKARFVFTVTGQELPRDMKIQIMTVAGRVVREIFMGELGPLHIGNNVTEFAWDGTDQYGDRLANGTYLYRVSLDDSQGQFKQRATAGDKAFKNDWGKLVLMR